MVEQRADALAGYHGTPLVAVEAAVMVELEQLVGKVIPSRGRISLDFGFVAAAGHVTKLWLSGKNLTSLPEKFGQLSALSHLELKRNQLISLPISFGSLKSLDLLELSSNALSSLPTSFGSLSALTFLDLSENRLITLPESFGLLSNLKNLFLIHNPIQSLPNSFGSLKSLAHLSLSANALSSLPVSFGSLSGLTELNLYKNNLTSLPENFGSLSVLRTLQLENNKLSLLPESFGALSVLQSLNLSYNLFTYFPSNIGLLISLQTLNLEGNHLTFLPESIKNLSALETLNISKNEFSSIPSSVFYLKGLKDVNLSKNCLSKIEIENLTQKMVNAPLDQKNLLRTILTGTGNQKKSDSKESKISFTWSVPYSYAVIGAIIVFLTLFTFQDFFHTLSFLYIVIFLFGAFIVKFITGLAIVPTLYGYIKRINDSNFYDISRKLAMFILKKFDIIVLITIIYAVRSILLFFFDFELIPVLNWIFSFPPPEWLHKLMDWVGYNLTLTFWANIDLFFGKLLLTELGFLLICWAFFRQGWGMIKSKNFKPNQESHWSFLIMGLAGGFCIAFIGQSEWDSWIDIGGKIGIFIACGFYLWNDCKTYLLFKEKLFGYYLGLISVLTIVAWAFFLISPTIGIIGAIGTIMIFIFYHGYFTWKNSNKDKNYWQHISAELKNLFFTFLALIINIGFLIGFALLFYYIIIYPIYLLINNNIH